MTGCPCSAAAMVEAMRAQEEPSFINRPLTKLQRCGWNLATGQGVEPATGMANKIMATSAESFLNARVSPGARRHES
ncbi:hypothetical protein SAMN05444165_3424 [Paraburkholderia phenazinium]|uniref:Uncharacterized protein n=1 Tax=Paraburkholderia phenazinium TaxID=60549 RepID=A0A1N6JQQ0_9BURK|nr:hypothetical protein SAMN05444165_3424 [Paraburkholderia phenazinium]